MLIHFAIFVAALFLLAKSADWFVEYSARMARRLGVSDLAIGLTVTSIGTSIPELGSSVSAALQHQPTIVLGNIVGSNIANIGLVLGIAAIIRPFATTPHMYHRDAVLMLAITVVFYGFLYDRQIVRLEAAVLLLVYVGYTAFVAKSDSDRVRYRFRDFLQFFLGLAYIKPLFGKSAPKQSLSTRTNQSATMSDTGWRIAAFEIAVIISSCAGVILGAKYLVEEAVWLAEGFAVPKSVIAMSLIAFGTSVPELMVAISAARKGKHGMIVGSVVGSNIANLLLVCGIASAIAPTQVTGATMIYTVPILLGFTLGLLFIIKTNWRVTRVEGTAALVAYAAFVSWLFI